MWNVRDSRHQGRIGMKKQHQECKKAKSLISDIKRCSMKKDEIEKRLETIFGIGSGQEIETATTKEKTVERIEELSKREQQLDEWERMKKEAKKRQREDRSLNLFWRRNKSFPVQFGGDEEIPGAEETLAFWRSISNKETSEGWMKTHTSVLSSAIQKKRIQK